MVSRHGNHLLVLNAKGNGRIYFAQLDFGHPPILVHTEGIVEVLADAFERLPCSEYVDPMDRGIIDEIEGPHVVQSSDMVFVFVRQQNRVDMPDPGPEHLVTEIGPTRAWPKSADGYRGDLSRCRRHTGSRSPALPEKFPSQES